MPRKVKVSEDQQDILETIVDLPDEAVRRIVEASADEGDARDLQLAFERFHQANPGVYRALVDLARKAQAAGHDRIGIGMLWEILRWETLVGDPKATDGYKLNNSHRSRYARLIMEQEEDLAEIFGTRRLTT